MIPQEADQTHIEYGFPVVSWDLFTSVFTCMYSVHVYPPPFILNLRINTFIYFIYSVTYFNVCFSDFFLVISFHFQVKHLSPEKSPEQLQRFTLVYKMR